MDLNIAGKHALVTGASQGLGRAIAGALVAEGVKVAICARNAAKVAAAARDLGGLGYACDLSRADRIDELLASAKKDLGHIDILVANTGGPPPSTFASTDDEMWRTAFEGVYMSAVRLIRACLPDMQSQRWGRIVVVTSIAAREPIDSLLLSNSLRPGLHGLINSLSREVGEGITVNALMPGFTLTERLQHVGFTREQAKSIPAGRAGEPAEFGAVAAFLASAQAAYITGQAIACDGGFLKSI